jgi:hypothetical protein
MVTPSLPVKGSHKTGYLLSLFAAFLMGGISLASLLFPGTLYATVELRRGFLSNDVVNLIVGLPVLLGALMLVNRGRWIGLLLWPGALLYITYTYIAYIAAMPLRFQTAVYAALVIVSAYLVVWLLRQMDTAEIKQRLDGRTPARFAGWVLVGAGALFFLRAAWQLASAAGSLSGAELGALFSDLLVTPAWIVFGILLLRRHALGYSTAIGLLFQAASLFLGLLIYFVLQPVLVAEPFALTDFLVVLIMGMVCFVPLGWFVRGAMRQP